MHDKLHSNVGLAEGMLVEFDGLLTAAAILAEHRAESANETVRAQNGGKKPPQMRLAERGLVAVADDLCGKFEETRSWWTQAHELAGGQP